MSVGGPSPPVGRAEDPLLGLVLSQRYRILKKLGEGGMGAVYLAEHVVIEKKIALKVLFPDLTRRPDLVHRFLQEAKSASRIGHENVIDINDFGQSDEGYVFIAMELLTGTELGHVLRDTRQMSWERAQPILLQIAKALRAAHEKGIIHRDMKPENVFIIQREGRSDFVKVLDFGIAKVMGMDQDGPRLTRTGMIFGTPEYMAPEQAQGAKIDPRVDVYSVGCIMYHMLTGDVPFRADSFMAVLSKHMLEEPLPPRIKNPNIDEEVERVILKALAKDPEARYQSMGELCEVLAELGPMRDLSGRVSGAQAPRVHSGRVDVNSGAVQTSEYAREMPLAPPNPEMRRSATEMMSRGTGAATRPAVDKHTGASSAQATTTPPSGSKTPVFLVAGVLAIAAVAGGIFYLRRPPPEAVTPPPVAKPQVAPGTAAPGSEAAKEPAKEATSTVAPGDPAAAKGEGTSGTRLGQGADEATTKETGKDPRRNKDEGRRRRSSREAIEALRASGSLTPESAVHPRESQPPPPAAVLPPDPTVRAAVPVVPAEIKNPFANPGTTGK